MAPDRILHAAVALAAVLALLLNAAQQTEPAAVDLLASLFLMVIVVTDAIARKIPNALVLPVILLGLAVNGHADSVHGMVAALAGMTVGLTLLLPFYLTGGMGAGDVKALAALGSLIGPAVILQTVLYTALIGGALSLLHLYCSSDLRQPSHAMLNGLGASPYPGHLKPITTEPAREKQRLPYAAAIALGFLAFCHWGSIVTVPW